MAEERLVEGRISVRFVSEVKGEPFREVWFELPVGETKPGGKLNLLVPGIEPF